MAYIPTGITSIVNTVPSSVQVGASIMGLVPVGLRNAAGTALNDSGGNLLVNIGNIATGTFGNTNNISSALTIALEATENFVWSDFDGKWQRWSGNASIGGLVSTGASSVITVIQGSVLTVGQAVGNQSVSGTVGASIVGQLPAGTAVLGSVATLQGTNPWVTVWNNSSILATQQGTRITSVISSTPSSMLVGASIIGLTPVTAVVTGNPSISGTVNTIPTGTIISSVVNTVPSSMLVGASIIGLTPVTAVITGNPSVSGNVTIIGSIAAVIIGGSVATATTNSSVMLLNGANVIGSVATLQGTNPWVITGSIVGTYSEDQAATSADKGLLAFGVRNDTVASLVGSDMDYGAWSQDSAGRHLTKPFTSEDGTIISYIGSVVSASVTLIQASAIGKRNYITDLMVVNTGNTAQLVTFQDGSTSVLGYTIAPAGGGSNAIGWNIPLKTAPAQDLAFKTTGTSSVVYLTVKGYQAP